jgi:hypothetical protein
MAEEKSAQLGISPSPLRRALDLLLTLIRRREYGGPGIPRNALAAAWFAMTGSGQRNYGDPLLAALALQNGRVGIQSLRDQRGSAPRSPRRRGFQAGCGP